MRRNLKWLVGMVLLCGAALFFGFVVFATTVMREPEQGVLTATADGIVVLTGGKRRLSEGSRLLKLNRGKRLLISGVNTRTTKKDLIAILKLEEEKILVLRRPWLRGAQHTRQCPGSIIVGALKKFQKPYHRDVQLSYASQPDGIVTAHA